MIKYIFFVLFSFSSLITAYSQNLFNLSVSGGLNFSNPFFSEPQNSEYEGLDQWGTLAYGWTLRSSVDYKITKRTSLFTGLRISNYHYIHNLEAFLRFGNEFITGNKSRIESHIKYLSLGIPIGIRQQLGEHFKIQTAFIYSHHLDSKVEGKLLEGGVDGGIRLGKGEYNEISKKNLSAEIGLLFQPKRLFKHNNKLFFFAIMTEFGFNFDKVYFSDSNARKLTTSFLVGFDF